MTSCLEISDRMPDVAHGRLRWTVEESEHLRTCETCGREWRIVTSAAALGRSLAVDGDRVAAGVAERLAQPRPSTRARRVRPILWLAGLAAAAAFGFAVLPRRSEEATEASRPRAVLTELDDLSAPELETVLDVLPAGLDEGPTVDPEGLGDLNTQELERVLRSLEG